MDLMTWVMVLIVTWIVTKVTPKFFTYMFWGAFMAYSMVVCIFILN